MSKKRNVKQKIVITGMLLALLGTGQAYADDETKLTRDELKDSLQTVDSLLVDKTLRTGSNYDIRVYRYIEDKTVGSTNENWALALTRALGLSNNNYMSISARHMDYSTALNSTYEGTPDAHYRNLGSGGNTAVGLSYMTSGKGPIAETSMPWENNLNRVNLSTLQSQNITLKLESYRKFPSVYKQRYENFITATDQETKSFAPGEIELNRNAIKEHILKYGPVVAKIYKDNSCFQTHYLASSTSEKVYFKSKEQLYYYTIYYNNYASVPGGLSYYYKNNDVTPNHEVVIIGWDDNYTNAYTGAVQKGAYLVVDADYYYEVWHNSYKKTDGMFSRGWQKNGNDITVNQNIYYVSYDDNYIESEVYGLGQIGYKDYSTIYQHDPLGMSTAINGKTYIGTAWGANVFKRNTTDAQILNEISVAGDEEMKYEVYVNAKDGDLSDDKLVKVAETDYLSAGYNTIKIDDQVVLTGNKFAVAIKYIAKQKTSFITAPRIGVESPTKLVTKVDSNNNATQVKETVPYWQNATSTPGQSYLKDYTNTWIDMYDEEDTQNMNLCIKAFVTDYPGYKQPYEKVEILEDGKVINNITMIKGDYKTDLVGMVYPDNVVDHRVTWTSDNKNIATVDKDGNITAVGGGTTIVRAYATGDSSVYAELTVKVDVPVDNMVLNKKEVTMLANETHILAPIISPEDATTKDVQWSSSNKDVCLVTDDGVLIGLKQGRANITAILKDDYGMHTAVATVVVPESLLVNVSDVKLNKTQMVLTKGTREQLEATVYPTDATNQSVVWSSNNKSVATVNASGKVTGLKAGTATITVTTVNGGEQATCNVTVVEDATVPVTGISLNKTKLLLEKGQYDILTATIAPSNSTNKSVTWISSNENVAMVSNSGKVTAIDKGTATITATTVDGKKVASCDVTVTLPNIAVTGVRLNKTGETLKEDEELLLIADVMPYNATNNKVTWSSNDSTVATVDQNGNVKAVGPGKAVITVTTEDGSFTKTCVITVPRIVPVQGISFDENTKTMEVGKALDLNVIFNPEDATNKNLTWNLEVLEQEKTEPSDSEENIEGNAEGNAEENVEKLPVAVVYDGKVVAYAKGKVKVTATSEDGSYTATCEITVTEQGSEIKVTPNGSYLVSEDNVIYNIPTDTKVKDFINNIETNGDIQIIDKKGNTVDNASNIGTGMTVKITKTSTETGELIEETFYVIVEGDINGDGKKTQEDVDIIARVLTKGETIDSRDIPAIDFNKNGKVDIVDLSEMMDYIKE